MNEQKMIDLVNRIADNDKVAPFQNGFVVLTNEEMVKFAESIVRECMSQIESKKENCGPSLLDGLDFAVETIQEHFGVEE